jgi:hypothetical protein
VKKVSALLALFEQSRFLRNERVDPAAGHQTTVMELFQEARSVWKLIYVPVKVAPLASLACPKRFVCTVRDN